MGKSRGTAFRIRLPDDELETVLQRVEENLALRPVLDPEPPAAEPEGPFDGLRARLAALRALRAPYFVLGGRVPGAVAAVLNLPLRVFGRKQRRFNEDLLRLLEQWLALHADAEQEGRMRRRDACGLEDWIRLVQRKQEALELELEALRRAAEPRGTDPAGP